MRGKNPDRFNMLSQKAVQKLHQSRGFTLVELVTCLVIFSIMAFAAVPEVLAFYRSFDKRNAEMQVMQDLRLSQARTVEQGCNGIFKFDEDEKGYSFGCDYVPYSETNPPTWDSIIFSRDLPSKVKASSDDLIIYNSRGQVVNDQSFLSSRSITFEIQTGSTYEVFNTGTLSATGSFVFSN